MNNLMLLVVALVALCYYGGKYCPAVLRQNKEMLLGVAIGMALCSFMDLKMEGFTTQDYMECIQGGHSSCETRREEDESGESAPNWMACTQTYTGKCLAAYEAVAVATAPAAAARAAVAQLPPRAPQPQPQPLPPLQGQPLQAPQALLALQLPTTHQIVPQGGTDGIN
jgi:hypothetical protein